MAPVWEKAGEDAGHHQFFVRGDDAHRDAAGGGTDERGVTSVGGGVEGEAKEFQPGADFRAHGGGMLADATGKDQGVQPSEGRRETADGFAGGVAEGFDGLVGGGVAAAAPWSVYESVTFRPSSFQSRGIATSSAKKARPVLVPFSARVSTCSVPASVAVIVRSESRLSVPTTGV